MKFVRMKYSKILAAILLAALAASLFFGMLSPLSANARAAEGRENGAAAEPLALSAENAALFLPASYEQYLSVQSPVDVALCGRYAAIAEGRTIYVVDRTAERPAYRKYTHESSDISKMQFSDGEKLYFSDRLLGFYELDLTGGALTASEQPLASLTTFLIRGEELFKVSVADSTTYRVTPLSQPDGGTQFGVSEYRNTPQLAYTDGEFYSVVGELVTVYTYDEATSTYGSPRSFSLGSNLTGLQSACAVGDTLYYSVSGSTTFADGLYACDLEGRESRLVAEGDGFGALTSFGGMLYAVVGHSVKEFSVGEVLAPTSYEIAAASSSPNRLADARDVARAGDLLAVADSGNKRVAVYDMKKERTVLIPCDTAPSYVATDGTIVAAAAENSVYVYEKDLGGDFSLAYRTTVGNTVSGIACLDGKCYFVTNGFGYGLAREGFRESDLVIRESGLDRFPPSALACDLYGGLYVVLSDGSVLSYTESSFLDKEAAGVSKEFTLPQGFKSVRVDFEGNLYCLNDAGALCKNGEPFAEIGGEAFVYAESEKKPVSFALGFEDDSVYFGFGDFLVRTNEGVLGFPTLGTIPTDNIYGELSVVHAPETVSHLDVKAGAVGIRVDLGAVGAETEYFPFASYGRTSQTLRGVLLGRCGAYCLVALYQDKLYDVQLFREEECTAADGLSVQAEGEKYLSSGCRLYRYPCVAESFEATLSRGDRVKVLSFVYADGDGNETLGHGFAYVEAETDARAAVRGYVPLSFLTGVGTAAFGDSYELVTLRLKKGETLTFKADDGEEIALSDGVAVRLYRRDGGLTACYTDENGKKFYATVTEAQIERGESDAWRVAVIAVLSVAALLIIGGYFYLLPRRKKEE